MDATASPPAARAFSAADVLDTMQAQALGLGTPAHREMLDKPEVRAAEQQLREHLRQIDSPEIRHTLQQFREWIALASGRLTASPAPARSRPKCTIVTPSVRRGARARGAGRPRVRRTSSGSRTASSDPGDGGSEPAGASPLRLPRTASHESPGSDRAPEAILAFGCLGSADAEPIKRGSGQVAS